MYRSRWGKELLSKCTAKYGGSVTFINYRSIGGSCYFQNVQVYMGKGLISKCTGVYGGRG